MTEKTLDWLNQNRFRAYPFINDAGLVSGGSRVPDSVLLDCLVLDTRKGAGILSLTFTKYVVSEGQTDVYFTYGDILSHCTIYDTDSSSGSDPAQDGTFGEGSFVRMTGSSMTGIPSQFVHMSMTFSSHKYILERVGTGTWEFSGSILPSRVVSAEASGVSRIRTNGSAKVQAAGTATGIVHLKDGYRTQPVISNGRVVVRVGTHYGIDPCHYPKDASQEVSCDDMLTFFCGQNAINGGNVVLSGGPGVSVSQGGVYTAKSDMLDTYGNVGIAAGEQVPCVEIAAASELLRIYRPTVPGSDSSGSSESSGDQDSSVTSS